MILSFYSPNECPVCGRELPESSVICGLCRSILEKERIPENSRCSVCYSQIHDGICEYCSSRNIFFNRHISLYRFSRNWMKVLHRWKFENDRPLVRIFIHALKDIIHLLPEDSLLLHLSSGISGYDVRAYQPCRDTEILLSRISGLKQGGSLKKNQRSRQSARSYKDRFVKIRKSYDPSNILYSKKYVLIEDLFTTGATGNEVAKILKENGAEYVMIISLLMREN